MVEVLHDEEATHGGGLHENLRKVAGPEFGGSVVVLRDLAANGDAGIRVQQAEDGVGNRAADIVEVAVNAFGTQLFELGVRVGMGLVVEG